MRASSSLLALGALAAFGAAAPASAQYYPGYGDPYGGNVVGRILDDVLGTGYVNGPDSRMVVDECTRAVEARLGGYGGYGYERGRVLGISQISPRDDGGIAVRGTALTANYPRTEVAWRCRTDGRGFIKEVAINPRDSRYRSDYGGEYDYSRYGYRRY